MKKLKNYFFFLGVILFWLEMAQKFADPQEN